MVPEFDQEGFELLKSQSKEELDKVEHSTVKWACRVKGCNHYTRISDYGVSPYFQWRKREWVNLETQVLDCNKHWKQFEKNGYPPETNAVFKEGPGIMHLIYPAKD